MITLLNVFMTSVLLTNIGVNVYQAKYGEALVILGILIIMQMAFLNKMSRQENLAKEVKNHRNGFTKSIRSI